METVIRERDAEIAFLRQRNTDLALALDQATAQLAALRILIARGAKPSVALAQADPAA